MNAVSCAAVPAYFGNIFLEHRVLKTRVSRELSAPLPWFPPTLVCQSDSEAAAQLNDKGPHGVEAANQQKRHHPC